MSKRWLTSAHLVFGLITFVSTATAAAPPLASLNKHCVVKIDPAGASSSAQAQEPKCYPTFSDAVFAATEGWIRLPRKATFSEQLDLLDLELALRENELKDGGSTVVAVDYENIDYRGASLTWTFSGPCTPSACWQAPNMPSIYVLINPHWNERVSSTRGYSKCDRNILFEHANYNPNGFGGQLTCWPNCSSVGSMNDKTSSRRWCYPDCSGIGSGWRGCRGTGCHACAELVAEYPCYFQNHPYCVSNSTCDGQYFLCSANCPAPSEYADRCLPEPPCAAAANCPDGGSVSCQGSPGSCFAVDNCYASCDGVYHFCSGGTQICPN